MKLYMQIAYNNQITTITIVQSSDFQSRRTQYQLYTACIHFTNDVTVHSSASSIYS